MSYPDTIYPETVYKVWGRREPNYQTALRLARQLAAESEQRVALVALPYDLSPYVLHWIYPDGSNRPLPADPDPEVTQ